MARKTAASPAKLTEYPGKELQAMTFASNYRRWIMDHLQPFIGRNVVEVGAGTGAFSELILGKDLATLTVLEPSPNLYAHLLAVLPPHDRAGVLDIRNSDFLEAFADGSPPSRPDTAVYINVLEHIE